MTVRRDIAGRGPAVGVMAGGALVVIVGSLLPWLRSGGRRRHSYDLLELVDRLGFAPGSVAAAALRWWPLVPLLAVSAVVAAWWGWPRVGGCLGVAAAIYAGGTAIAVIMATPSSATIDPLFGAVVTVAGGLVLLGGAVVAVVIGARGPIRWRRPARP